MEWIPNPSLRKQPTLKDTLILNFQPPEPWENKFLLCKPRILWSFFIPGLGNEYNFQIQKCQLQISL